MMRILFVIALILGGLTSCSSLKQTSAVTTQSEQVKQQGSIAVVPDEQPAQAQIPTTEIIQPAANIPVFSATEVLQKASKITDKKPDALASTDRKALSESLRKPLGLSKLVFKAVEKKIVKEIKKRRPAQQDGTILGFRPLLFFALLAVLVGIVLLFVTGKSQFFSILTLLLLIGGLLISVAAFLDIL